MDFRNLQYFMTVAQELSFSRAAEKLNMSQPPLSYQIKQLEDELGTPLFIRGSRRLTLTDAGEILLQRSRQIMALSDKTKSDIASLSNELTGTVHLGIVEGCAPFYAARWICDFHNINPLVQFELRNGSSDDIIDELSRGLIDIALIALPYDTDRMEGTLVAAEPWCAFIPADHPLAAMPGDSIPLSMLAGESIIIPRRRQRRDAILRWFDSIGATPHIMCSLANYVNVLALTESGAGIAIFPRTHDITAMNIVCKTITDPPKYAEYALVHAKDMNITGASLLFLNFIEEKLRSEQSGAPGIPLYDSEEETEGKELQRLDPEETMKMNLL